MTTNDVLTLVVATVSAVVALGVLIQAVLEYRRQGRQRRAEQFYELRRKLKDPEVFGRIAALIDLSHEEGSSGANAIAELRTIAFQDKRNYVGHFEEVALAMNSGLLRKSVANYMFGYYAILCADSPAFWETLNPLNPYWSVFYDFVAEMRKEQSRFSFRRRDFRF